MAQHVLDLVTTIKRQFDAAVNYIKSDMGTEFTNHYLQKSLKRLGIIQQFSQQYVGCTNGVAEASNKILLTRARSLMLHAGLPDKFWDFALTAQCFLTNRTPRTRDGGQLSSAKLSTKMEISGVSM